MHKVLKKFEVLYEANMFTLEGNLMALKTEGGFRDDGMNFFFQTPIGGVVSIQWDDSRSKAQRLHSFMRKNVDCMDSFWWDAFFIRHTKLFFVAGDDDDVDEDDEAKHPRDDDDDGINENQTLNDLRKENAAKKAGAKPKVAIKKDKKAKLVLKSEVKGALQQAKGADGKTRTFYNPYAPKK